MTLDIRGGRKNTAINYSDYVAFEEMLSNAIDSYLIRKSRVSTAPPFLMKIDIKIIDADFFGGQFGVEIVCSDNGSGFGDDEVKAFVTKDSTYKDQLQIPGIGKCKGAGRIQFFHHFDRLSIDSVIERSGSIVRKTLQVDELTREISENSFNVTPADGAEVQTTFTLKSWRQNTLTAEQKTERGSIPEVFSASAVTDHLYTSLLQRLITLKKLIGDFRIEVSSSRGNKSDKETIEGKDLPESVGQVAEIPLTCIHSKEIRTGPKLRVTRYSFPESEFPNFQHEVALCANSAVVQSITKRYLRHVNERKRATAGSFELLLVESELFEEKVNQQRDGFDIPFACSDNDTLLEEFSLDDVVDSLEDYVFQIITPSDFDKDILVALRHSVWNLTRKIQCSSRARWGLWATRCELSTNPRGGCLTT